MTQPSKIEAYKQRMEAFGVSQATAFPPAWRILWRFGVEVPPPPFLAFLPLAFGTGTTFSLLFGFALWLLGSAGLITASTTSIPARAAMAGALFGLLMAAYYRHLARKQRLGSWADFPSVHGSSQRPASTSRD